MAIRHDGAVSFADRLLSLRTQPPFKDDIGTIRITATAKRELLGGDELGLAFSGEGLKVVR